jgi:hypothetical protein
MMPAYREIGKRSAEADDAGTCVVTWPTEISLFVRCYGIPGGGAAQIPRIRSLLESFSSKRLESVPEVALRISELGGDVSTSLAAVELRGGGRWRAWIAGHVRIWSARSGDLLTTGLTLRELPGHAADPLGDLVLTGINHHVCRGTWFDGPAEELMGVSCHPLPTPSAADVARIGRATVEQRLDRLAEWVSFDGIVWAMT